MSAATIALAVKHTKEVARRERDKQTLRNQRRKAYTKQKLAWVQQLSEWATAIADCLQADCNLLETHTGMTTTQWKALSKAFGEAEFNAKLSAATDPVDALHNMSYADGFWFAKNNQLFRENALQALLIIRDHHKHCAANRAAGGVCCIAQSVERAKTENKNYEQWWNCD